MSMSGGAPDHHHHRHPSVASDARPDFEPAQHAMTLYYRALSGRGCEIVPYDDDADLWQHPDTATTIRLPSHAPLDDHGSYTDAAWYQVALTHRALHHTLGTFRLDLARDEPLFTRLRPDPPDDVDNVPALERFARLFGRTALAVEVFALCEDTRIDAAAQRLLPGLGAAYRAVRHAARHDRPDLALLPPRSAVAEALVRFSLGADSVTAPAALAEPMAIVVAAADRLQDPRATAESSAEATIRIYDVLAGLPNVGPIRAVRPMVFADLVSTCARISTIRRSGSSGTNCGSKATRSSTYGSFRCGTETRPGRGMPVSRRPECRCRRRSCA